MWYGKARLQKQLEDQQDEIRALRIKFIEVKKENERLKRDIAVELKATRKMQLLISRVASSLHKSQRAKMDKMFGMMRNTVKSLDVGDRDLSKHERELMFYGMEEVESYVKIMKILDAHKKRLDNRDNKLDRLSASIETITAEL